MDFSIRDQIIDKLMEHPERPVIVDGETKLKGEEFLTLAGKVARHLMDSGVLPGDIVTIELPRSAYYTVAMMGSWMAGIGIAPLSPLYPRERLDQIEEICEVKVVIDEEFISEALKKETLKKEEMVEVSADMPAVIIFTSGSTGKPKGVVHTHRTMTHGTMVQVKTVSYTPPEGFKYAMIPPFTFIAGVIIFTKTLVEGGTICLVPTEAIFDVHKLEDYLDENNIDVVFISPKVLKVFHSKNKALRIVYTGSEKLTDVAPGDYKIYNMYAMSEVMPISYYDVDKAYDNTPVGKPFPGLTLHILDENGQEAEEGEVCVGSDCTCFGYYKAPEITAQAFRPNPYAQEDGVDTLFHTGDIAKKLPDGNLLYLNRKDWMIKINGQRVEPGEIETAMRQFSEIGDVAAKGWMDESGEGFLCAYYTENSPITVEELRDRLTKALPTYMVPSVFMQLDKIPFKQQW